MAHRSFTSFAALTAAFPVTIAAQTVVVGPGETLTRADLDSGIFNGQPFELGPETTFEIAGGTFDVLSDDSELPFDMRSSAILATDAGRVEASVLENVSLIIDGGEDVTADIVNATCVLVSGSISELRANATTFLMTGGSAFDLLFNELLLDQSGSTVQIDGGTIDSLFCRNKADITINGGEIDDVGTTEFTSSIVFNGGNIEEITVTGVLFPQSGQPAERPELFVTDGSIGSLVMIEFERFVMTGGEVTGFVDFIGDFGSKLRPSTVDLLGGAIADQVTGSEALSITIDGTILEIGAFLPSTIDGNSSIRMLSGRVSGNGLITDFAGVRLAGGIVDNFVDANGSWVSVTGGELRDGIFGGEITTFAGGIISGPINVPRTGTLILKVESVAIDGIPLPLVPGQPVEIPERNGELLTAVLADGSPFMLELSENGPSGDSVPALARVVALQGDRACVGDLDLDGSVTLSDVRPLLGAFLVDDRACDQNGDGLCNPADFNAWIINANAGC
ncbi:MAG: hypothetical protein AAGJ54_04470 [Planctomycetota bacterium]